MAESSTTASSSRISAAERYDVFIGHCGRDCKRDFAVWLNTELKRVGIWCFFDECGFRVGDPAASKLL